MKQFRSAFLPVFLLLLLCSSLSAQTDTRASKTWEVQKYDLSVNLPTVETDRLITVRAQLSLKNVSAATASSLSLRISPNAEISEIKINNTKADFTKNEEKAGINTLQRLVLRGVGTAAGGNLTAEVNYKLKVEENSGIASLTPISAHFLPESFWYPTPNSWFFPRGADFAPFKIAVTGQTTVVASGIAQVSAFSKTFWEFEQKLSAQPFFVAGSWEIVSNKNVSVYWPKGVSGDGPKRANELAELADEARQFYSKLLDGGNSLPLQIVAVRRGAGFADGGTLLLDENVFRRQKIDSFTAMQVAESIAKIWFGNLTPVSGDGYGAIREGLSRFLATQFIESKFGKEIADIERMRQRSAYSAYIKRDAPLRQVTPLDDYFYSTNANKGAMIWRLLAKKVGQNAFFEILKANTKTGGLDLAKLRGAFSAQKELLDYGFDQISDMDLMVGLPQAGTGETKAALRNSGSIEAVVDILGITDKGERLIIQTTIPAKNFGEAIFKTPNKIVRIEIDSEKLFPQTDYANDLKPLEIDEGDRLLFIKRVFDKQDYAAAEKNALLVLRDNPRFDDARVLLARAMLAQNKNSEAEREFRLVLDEKLPTARSLAWANVGLGELALRNGQSVQAANLFSEAIQANAETGANLAARQGKLKANVPVKADESVKAFFTQFDKAAISNNKAAVEALILNGEIKKTFTTGIAGQAQEWTSQIVQIESLDANNILVEANLNIRFINKNPEMINAVFRLTKVGATWKLSDIPVFENR